MLGVCGTLSSVLGTLFAEWRREGLPDSPTLAAVPLFGKTMPGKPSSGCSDRGTGVWDGSTETTDLIGKTRSSAEGLMKEELEIEEEGEGELAAGV